MADPVATVRGFPAPAGPLDLDLHVGDVVLLRGRNGSGKTSLLRSLAGLDAPLRPSEVAVGGRDPATAAAALLPSLLAFAPQEPLDGLAGLTVAGEFRLRGEAMPPALADLGERDVATLSSGQARRVALAVGVASHAPLLLLDEPADGLDASRCRELLALVAARAKTGAVVVADHTGVTDGVATRVVGLDAVRADAPLPSFPSGSSVVVSAPAVSVRRGEQDVALPAVSLPSGLHALAGPNASGKSTLLLRLAGLLDSSDVLLTGRAVQAGHNARLLLPRAGDLFTREDVASELRGADPAVADALVPPLLRSRHPFSLSAGEAQRVALAKTLGRPAPLYLLDEPEAHLDPDGRAVLWDLLARRAGDGSCILAATHDAALLAAAHTTLRLGGSA